MMQQGSLPGCLAHSWLAMTQATCCRRAPCHRWLLAQQASGKLGASVASLALCEAPASHPILAGMCPAPAPTPSAGTPPAAAPSRRVLLVACVPGQVDVTHFHTMGSDPQRDALRLAGTLRSAWALLESTTLGDAFGTVDWEDGAPSAAAAGGAAGSAAGPGSKLSQWSSCCQGVDAFVSAASTWSTSLGLAAATTSPGPTGTSGASARSPPNVAAGQSASAEIFVCTVARGVLGPAAAASAGDGSGGGCLLSTVVQRAAAAGLSLVGMQTLYLGEEACSYVARHTSHRCERQARMQGTSHSAVCLLDQAILQHSQMPNKDT